MAVNRALGPKGLAPSAARRSRWAALAVLLLLASGSTCRKADVAGALDRPVSLRRGQWASFEGHPLELAFLRVVEDSRCPMNAVCVRQGPAVVQLQGKSSAAGFGVFLAELPGGVAEADTTVPWTTWGGYRVRLLRLEPYPQAGVAVDSAAFVATLVVSDAD